MDGKTDAVLVEELKQGNEQALSEIYQRYEKSLFYIAYKITNNKEDAQDALQDTFLQVSRSIHHLQRPEYLKLWLNRIVAGKCRDIFRHNKTVSVDMDDPKFYNQYAEERTEFVPERSVRFKNDQEVVDYYISQLPYAQREALVLTYFEHMSMQEIADALQEPVGTIKSRIHLAKKTLHQRLMAYESRERIKLDFHSVGFDAWLTLMYTASADTMTKALAASGGVIAAKSSGFSLPSLIGGVGGKIAVAGIVSITMGTGVLAYQSVQSQQQKKNILQEIHQINELTLEEYTIRNDHDAYFLLMNWAMNEEQMQTKAQDEIDQYRPIYEYLKSHNSAYFKAMSEAGMSTVLEAYF